MRQASVILSDYISSKLQVKEQAPNMVVYFRHRYWDYPNLWDGSDIENEWYQLTNRVVSLEIQESVDQFASSFTITFANDNGELSPDNYTGKWPTDIPFGGTGEITYARQLYPNSQVRIYLGYGDQLIPFIHGYTGEADHNSDSKTITVQCMTSYKKILHQTILPDSGKDVITAPTGNLYDVLKFFFDRAGVTLHGEKLYVPSTLEEWIIKGAQGKRFQAYDEVVRELIDSTYHYIRANEDGSCTVMPIPRFMRQDDADFIFDDYVNLTSLQYKTTDQDIYSAVVVKCGDYMNGFTSSFLLKDVNLGFFREELVEVPWADTYLKRRDVALAHHTKNLHKWRTMNVGVVGDPRIQLWDKIGIRDQNTSQTWVWHVKGIQTMISEQGFFQVLDLSANYGFDTTPYSDLSPIQVNVDTIRLKVWDWDVEDGDVMNIYNNNKLVKSGYMLKNNPTYVDIPLGLGNNIIVFEAVTCAKGVFTGRLQVLDTNNNILFDVGSLPDLTFPRANVEEDGKYIVKPSKSWVVARVN